MTVSPRTLHLRRWFPNRIVGAVASRFDLAQGDRVVVDCTCPLGRQEATIVSSQAGPGLQRSLSLLQATLYGLGVTIGAGIYVLVGAATARSGMHAPFAFVLAAMLMALSAASFAELAGRLPVAAGEAAYVKEAFQSTARRRHRPAGRRHRYRRGRRHQPRKRRLHRCLSRPAGADPRHRGGPGHGCRCRLGN